jgi:mRNA interferase HigB
MHVIAKPRLVEFWGRRPDAEPALASWYHEARAAHWANSAQIQKHYGAASIIDAERVVFNIRGNKYRLVVRINYGSETVFVRFIGTHQEYDRIDVRTV